jgi:UDP-N-acetylmuramoyl-tripeptide--D-alanyl-D-alanine ligase
MQKIILSLLAYLARAIIMRHKPYVIGVTGSIGKTTLTTYISEYLRLIYGESAVGVSPYHYNGEYGLPLTIMGAKTGAKNPLLWIIAFTKGIVTYLKRSYPKYIILEYGIDHSGEMEYLVSIVKPDIAVLSVVVPTHMEQFGSFERYRRAKLLLVESAKSYSIVHESLRTFCPWDHISFYGRDISSDAHVIRAEQSIDGIDTTLISGGQEYSLTLPSFGTYQAENILPLYLIGSYLSIDSSIIADNAHIFTPEDGRSRILIGKNDAMIIDGSYNGGFEAICRGIDSLVPFAPTHRIILLLGDMRELGEHTEEIHERLWAYIREKLWNQKNISLYLVGPLMEQYVLPIVWESISTHASLSSRMLGGKIRLELSSDDISTIVYVKWSQNTIFLEEWVKEFLKNPLDTKLLCRQSKEWMRNKEEFFEKIFILKW